MRDLKWWGICFLLPLHFIAMLCLISFKILKSWFGDFGCKKKVGIFFLFNSKTYPKIYECCCKWNEFKLDEGKQDEAPKSMLDSFFLRLSNSTPGYYRGFQKKSYCTWLYAGVWWVSECRCATAAVAAAEPAVVFVVSEVALLISQWMN